MTDIKGKYTYTQPTMKCLTVYVVTIAEVALSVIKVVDQSMVGTDM